jgi:hypothetical protein
LIPSVFASGSEFVVVFIYLVKIPNRVFWLHRGIISDAFNISLKFRMKVSNLDFIIHGPRLTFWLNWATAIPD